MGRVRDGESLGWGVREDGDEEKLAQLPVINGVDIFAHLPMGGERGERSASRSLPIGQADRNVRPPYRCGSRGNTQALNCRLENHVRRDFDDFLPDGHEDPVWRCGRENGTASEAAECGQDEGVISIEKARQAQRSASAVRNSNNRMPVAGNVQLVTAGVRRIVYDADRFSYIETGHGTNLRGKLFQFHIVISDDERHGQPKLEDELGKCGL